MRELYRAGAKCLQGLRRLRTSEARGRRGRRRGKCSENPVKGPGGLGIVLALKGRGWSSPPADSMHFLFDPLWNQTLLTSLQGAWAVGGSRALPWECNLPRLPNRHTVSRGSPSTDNHMNRVRLDPLSCSATIPNQFSSVLKGSKAEIDAFTFLFLFSFLTNLSFLLGGSKKNPRPLYCV